jgi:hypothetical protein
MASVEKLPSDALIKSSSLAHLSPDLGKYAQVSELLAQVAKASLPGSSHAIGGIMHENTWSCEILAPGSAWRKGRLSLTIEVEFLSDEPVSPPVAEPTSAPRPVMEADPVHESAFPGTVLDLD